MVYKTVKKFVYIQNQTFLRHNVKKFRKSYDKSKYLILYTPYLEIFAMLVSKQFLFWLYLQNWNTKTSKTLREGSQKKCKLFPELMTKLFVE